MHYTDVTAEMSQRIVQHRERQQARRTYEIHRLVYVEFHEEIGDAIVREKRVKKWRRAWKIELIERDNPEWRDLFFDLNC